MTGQWESYLQRIHQGAARLEPFLAGIEEYVRKVVERVGQEGGRRWHRPMRRLARPQCRGQTRRRAAPPQPWRPLETLHPLARP